MSMCPQYLKINTPRRLWFKTHFLDRRPRDNTLYVQRKIDKRRGLFQNSNSNPTEFSLGIFLETLSEKMSSNMGKILYLVEVSTG